MSLLKPIIIDRFDGGLTEDKRSTQSNKFSLTKHFDAFTFPHKLVPYVKTEPNENTGATAGGDTNAKAYKIVKFLYAPWLSSGAFRLYGLGIDTGTKAAVYTYNIDAGVPDTTAWETPTNNASALNTRSEDVFFYYKQYIYMFANGTKLIRFDTTVSAAFNDNYQSISYTNVVQPVHHPSDDCAYFFADNVVYRLNGTSWEGAVLTLPDNMIITAGTAHGNYLEVACRTKGSADIQSVVFEWDRDSSLTTISGRYDFGTGKVVHLASLDGRLIAVMTYFIDSLFSLNKGRVFIKTIQANTAVPLNELTVDSTAGVAPSTRFIRDNKLYFPMAAPLNGDTRFGVWVVDSLGRVSLDFIEEEATSYEGIFATGNLWWIAHSGDGSINRSDDNRVYSTTLSSVYESLIFNIGDASLKKKLVGVSVMFEPLPTAGQVILKYRKDEQTSWTTIFTHTTDNSISYSSVKTSTTNLPEFKEIQFQILSTGGAVITGLKFQAELTGKAPY